MVRANLFLTSLIVASASASALRSNTHSNAQLSVEAAKLKEESRINSRRLGEEDENNEQNNNEEDRNEEGEQEENRDEEDKDQEEDKDEEDRNEEDNQEENEQEDKEEEKEDKEKEEENHDEEDDDDNQGYGYGGDDTSSGYYGYYSNASTSSSWQLSSVFGSQVFLITAFSVFFAVVLRMVCYVPKRRITQEDLKENLVDDENDEASVSKTAGSKDIDEAASETKETHFVTSANDEAVMV